MYSLSADPAGDKVIKPGDPIPGYASVSRVSFLQFQHPGINDAGQLVFQAQLEDGTQVIARAGPPNLPPVVTNPGAQSAPEGAPWGLQIQASDPENNEPLIYSVLATGPAGAPVLTLTIDPSSGFISGTPAPGSTDIVYTVTVTVQDSLGAATTITFTLTITPAARTGLTAIANPDSASINLSWNNPSPDTVARIEVEVIGETTVNVAPGTTTYSFINGVGGRTYCFKVRGISAGGLKSPDSNQACAVFPQLKIENIASLPTADGVTITWTTSLPSTINTSLTPLTPGATTNLQEDATHTSFTYTASGLTATTAYTLHILAESIPGLLPAFADVPFTTLAAGGGSQNNGPPPQAQNSTLRVRALTHFGGEQNNNSIINVRITNTSPGVLQNLIIVLPQTILELDLDAETSCPLNAQGIIYICVLQNADPLNIGTLGRGEHRDVRLTFPFWTIKHGRIGQSGNASVNLFLGVQYDGLSSPTQYGVLLVGQFVGPP